jgi:hypothetical protein
VVVGFVLLPLFIWLFEGSLMLVRYVLLPVGIFMLVRNLPGIKQLLAKGAIEDIIYNRQQKKVE